MEPVIMACCVLMLATLLSILIIQITIIQKLKENNLQLQLFSTQTPLPNRTALYQDLKKSLSKYGAQNTAILYVDIDKFRYIHVIEDHDYADLVLTKVSERLVALAQPKGKVYHLSEDKFIVLFPNTCRRGMSEVLAANILAGFKERFEILGNEIYINLNIGIVDNPPVDMPVSKIITAAEVAMHHAHQKGKNQYSVYSPSLSQALKQRTDIQNHLRLAFERNEFEIYYQPILDLDFDSIDGFEALIRWKSKELGEVPPSYFIEIAENTHLIEHLGTWVLRKSCAFLKKLEKMGYSPLNMSVNVSVVQLMQDDFVTTVQETLEFLDLSPEHLELEITESTLMQSYDLVLPKLKQLRDIGVRIALDDFGTGYSSLSYLSQLPINTLKLDKSFIDKIGTDHESLTESLLYLCKQLDITIVAEGVEKDSQVSYLKRMNCDKMQGFLFSKPMTEADAITLLKSASTLFDEPFPPQSKPDDKKNNNEER